MYDVVRGYNSPYTSVGVGEFLLQRKALPIYSVVICQTRQSFHKETYL